MRALDRPVDKFLDYALWLTMRDLEGYWMPSLRAGKFDDGGDARRLVFALKAVELAGGSSSPWSRPSRRARSLPADEDRVRALIASLGGPRRIGV